MASAMVFHGARTGDHSARGYAWRRGDVVVHDSTQGWVGDWDGRGYRLGVARNDDVSAAHQLVARLQALLEDR